MRSLVTIAMVILALAGCEKEASSAYTKPPNGNGTRNDVSGAKFTRFQNIGTLRYGETKDAALNQNLEVGYTFAANEGDRPELRLTVTADAVYSMAVYGPRTIQGLWGEALAERNGKSDLVIGPESQVRGGTYFVLLRLFDTESATARISLTCEGCDEPPCAEAVGCDRFCADGFEIDDSTGCNTCECRGNDCALTGCLLGRECVYRCERAVSEFCLSGQSCSDGTCNEEPCPMSCGGGEACIDGECKGRVFSCIDSTELCESKCPRLERPVCGTQDGASRTYANQCRAECAGVKAENIEAGFCPDQCGPERPCPDGQTCDQGRCRDDACVNCPPEMPGSRLCGRDGQNYGNQCLLDCAGVEVDYPGGCVNRCNDDRACGIGQACLPVSNRRVPGNQTRCQMDPQGPACVRTCRRRPTCQLADPNCSGVMISRPMGGAANGSGMAGALGCYPFSEEEGYCLPQCDPNNEAACGAGVCAVVDHFSDRRPVRGGICLKPCASDSDCPAQLGCKADYNGRMVCQSCACDRLPQQLVCVEGTRHQNGCAALCAGVETDVIDGDVPVEVCDGEDNDCNGTADDGIAPRPCGDPGECGRVQRCENGVWGACDLAKEPPPEVCDGEDNDCDGQIDENLIERCGSNVGECRLGQRECTDGRWTRCDGQVLPAREVCDRLDNDCDGDVDEQLARVFEVCDGEDNDCDGSVDEGLGGRMEVCDNQDNDCDGIVDEGNRLVRVGCVDDAEPCVGAQEQRVLVRPCGSGIGECKQGHNVCSEGVWGGGCVGSRDAQDEVCDGRDNDCDRRVDEGVPRLGVNPNGMDCRPDCSHCPVSWTPVCGSDGLIYSSQCRAECVTGQVSQPYAACLGPGIDEVRTRCNDATPCVQSGRNGQICAAQRYGNDVGGRITPWANCFVTGRVCECQDNGCGFRVTDAVNMCLRRVQAMGDPQPRPDPP